MALVQSADLSDLLEAHGAALVDCRFGDSLAVPSIQIMLEELGPNLWEKNIDRYVDYGHTFSKLLEMVPRADVMHGEAVNVDSFFCIVLSHLRGYVKANTARRVLKCMQSLSLPTHSANLISSLEWQSCKDAVEHWHG